MWLDSITGHGKPFYVNIWFNEPHSIEAAPDSFTNRHSFNKNYYGSIENMDAAVGRLVKYLDQKGLADNTLVLFSSDNGSPKRYSNDPFRGAKAFNYEGGVRVPFIACYPEVIPENTKSEQVGSFTDVYPTIAEFAGIALPGGRIYDGINLKPVLSGELKEVESRPPVFFFRYFHDPICMLREGPWCLLGYTREDTFGMNINVRERALFKPDSGEPPWSQWGFRQSHMDFALNVGPVFFELYNLEDDPMQKNNMSDNYPERVEMMKKQMLLLKNEMMSEGGNWFD